MHGLLTHVLVSCWDAMQVLKSTAIRKYAGDLAYKDRALATDDALLIGRLHTYLSGSSMPCTFAFEGRVMQLPDTHDYQKMYAS